MQSSIQIVRFDTNQHSVFLLHYHLILVVKYRRAVMTDEISDYAREIFVRLGADYGLSLDEWNHDKDHVHILFRAQPKSPLSKFINAYKSASSRLIKRDFPAVREKLWQSQFWSQSFCLLTTGGVSADMVRSYIQTQGQRS